MLSLKLFAVLWSFLFVSQVQAENGVYCEYHDFASRFYFCEMSLQDSDGTDKVAGLHLGLRNDDDVTRVDLSGKAAIFPSIICSQFKNLKKILSTSDLEIERLSNYSLYSCENLIELHLEVGLKDIENEAFSKTENIQILHLNSNKLTLLHESLFCNLKNLKELNLAGNQFTTLPDELFTPLSNSLQRLSLNNCSLSDWNASWIQGLKLLTYIDLGSNNITEFPRNSFHPQNKISALFLDSNNINRLDFFSFGNLEKLEFFHAERNKINELDFYIFEQPKKLKLVNLEKNICINRTFEDFDVDKTAHMTALVGCFNKFDEKTIEVTTTPNSSLFLISTHQKACKITISKSSEVSIFFTKFPNISIPYINIHQDADRCSYQIYFDGVVNSSVFTGRSTFEIMWTDDRFMTEMSGSPEWNPFQINFIGVESENTHWTIEKINLNI